MVTRIQIATLAVALMVLLAGGVAPFADDNERDKDWPEPPGDSDEPVSHEKV